MVYSVTCRMATIAVEIFRPFSHFFPFPLSPFRERVLLLISDVGCFFSQCSTISKQQHKLDDNACRLRFMFQFHGDIEGHVQ